MGVEREKYKLVFPDHKELSIIPAEKEGCITQLNYREVKISYTQPFQNCIYTIHHLLERKLN